MSEEKKIFCFNAKLNSDRHFNPESDTFKKTYILIDNEKLLLKDLWEEHKQLKRLQAENEELTEVAASLLRIQYALADSCNKYRKALEEIREIVEKEFCEDDTGYGCPLEKISTKISEVLDERD